MRPLSRFSTSLSAALVCASLVTACGDTRDPSGPDAATNTADASNSDADPTAPQTPEAPAIERAAVVVETVSTEKYTFAKMDACGSVAWVAGPVHTYEAGQSVKMVGGMGMTDFHSDTLDRTFEKILFVDSWEQMETAVVCDGADANGAQGEAAPPTPAGTDSDGDATKEEYRVGTVQEAIDAAGYTYARLDICGEDVWIAAPTTRVEIGSYGATPIGSEMTGFKSTTLERTFDSVWFVPWIKRSKALPPCG